MSPRLKLVPRRSASGDDPVTVTGPFRAVLRLAVGEVRIRLALVAGLSVAGALCEVGALVLVARVAARLAAQDGGSSADVGPLQLLPASVGVQIGVGLGLVATRLACQLGASWLSAASTGIVRRRLARGLLTDFEAAAWEIQSVDREGTLLHLAGQELDRAGEATLRLAALAASACSLVMLVAGALWVNPLVAGATIVAVGLLHAALRPLTERARRRVLVRSRCEADASESLSEVVRMAEEVSAFGVGKAVVDHVDRDIVDVARHEARVTFLDLAVSTIYQGVALTTVLAALGGISIVDPAQPATLAAVVLVLLRAFAYSQQAKAAHHAVSALLPSVQHVADERARYRSRTVSPGTKPLVEVSSLRLDQVGYEYVAGRRALDGVTVDIRAGSTVGVIGPSGAGKSTLVQILLGLREPTSGRYLVNGHRAHELRRDEWARRVSLVPQEPRLIAGTVADNIRFHRPHIADEAVVAAARAARIDGDVARWPLGYAAALGPRGAALSGGQRQRICLARALADRPDLLVLDEPTSALDPRSEALVCESLRALAGHTTVVVVAHRLSTLAICDWLLVLDSGRLVASGTPDELAGRGGYYREALQLSGLA